VTPAPEPQGSKSPVPCPICGKPKVAAHRPFCSKRCAEVDLGRWLKGQYALPGDPSDEIGGRIDDDIE